jgi:hypothetical protein
MEEATRATVIVEDPGETTKVWVTGDGRVVGQMFGEEKTGPEVPFEKREHLVRRWDEVRADEIIRDLMLRVDENGQLIT